MRLVKNGLNQLSKLKLEIVLSPMSPFPWAIYGLIRSGMGRIRKEYPFRDTKGDLRENREVVERKSLVYDSKDCCRDRGMPT